MMIVTENDLGRNCTSGFATEPRYLDTGTEETFDRLSRLAADAIGVPVALITFVDEARVWLKSRIGTEVSQTPRDQSLCGTAIAGDDVLIVENATTDRRFATSTTVTELGARFYAGAPVRLAGGAVVGTICVLDIKPRPAPDVAQLSLLRGLAAAVGHLLDLRRELAQRREAERKLADHAKLLQLAEDMAGVGTWRIDLATGTITLSPASAKIFGLPATERAPSIATLISTFDPADRARVLSLIKDATATGDVSGDAHDFELRRIDDGARREVRVKAQIEWGISGKKAALVGMFRDVTIDKKVLRILNDQRIASDRRAMRMTELAATDLLTGLPNRGALIERVESVLAHGVLATFALIDLDHFKTINDEHGHDAGDRTLQAFGRACRELTDATHVFGRLGGEEFGLLVIGRRAEEATKLIAQLRMIIASCFITAEGGRNISFTFSAGLAEARGGDDWRSLAARADAALYRAKHEGRDRHAIAA